MDSRRLLLLVMILSAGAIAWAQGPTYGLGRTPTAEEVRAWDIAISPTGKELPPGHGSAKEGAQLYVQKGCAGCHGAAGSGGRAGAPVLIRRQGAVGVPSNAAPANAPARSSAPAQGGMAGMQMGPAPCLAPCVNDGNVMALHSPYATVMWDYISRGMPINREGTLVPDEVYSLVAFLLYRNGVIKEDDVLDQQTLPKIEMPNRNGFALPSPEWKHGTPRLPNYP